MIGQEAREFFPFIPTSPYSASKAAGELLLQSYHKTYGLPLIIVRCCNNYGPRQYPEKLISMAITRLLSDKKVLLHGDGHEIREWIYVKSCVEKIFAVLNGGEIGEVYNIGSGLRRNNLEIIHFILSIMGLSIGNEFIEKTVNRPNNDFRYAIDCTLFNRKIHSCPEDNENILIQNLRETIFWYKNNPTWWEGVVDLDSNLYQKGESLR
jgi:dTDP-glucose 4,6-dehydratase